MDTKNKCQSVGITFIPVICEADGGGWGPYAHRGEQSSIIATRLLQSLGLILHRENARSVLRRFPTNSTRECSELLAASAVIGDLVDDEM